MRTTVRRNEKKLVILFEKVLQKKNKSVEIIKHTERI